MTKKHFIRFAEYIRDASKYADAPFSDAQINHLADFCHEANPRFNRERWIGYIKGENGKNGGKRSATDYKTVSARCSLYVQWESPIAE